MLPKVTVIGRVGRDPETIETKSGRTLTKFSVAADRRKNDERGAMWLTINCWNNELGNMPVAKGSSVMVTGALDTNVYTNKDGVQVTTLEVNAHSVDFTPASGQKRDDSEGFSGGGNNRRNSVAADDWSSDDASW